MEMTISYAIEIGAYRRFLFTYKLKREVRWKSDAVPQL